VHHPEVGRKSKFCEFKEEVLRREIVIQG
jgi:hypothetical protein